MILGAAVLTVATVFLRLGLALLPEDEKFLSFSYIAAGAEFEEDVIPCGNHDCACAPEPYRESLDESEGLGLR